MTRFLAALAAPLALAVVVQSAGAQVIEIGATKEVAKPACPSKPCLALTRTTGYQAKVGTTRGLMVVPKSGRIVAWTVALGDPGPDQVKFFQDGYGGTAQAALTVMRPGARLFGRVMAQSPTIQLQPFFGTVAQFPLVRSIPVHKGWVLGLTVPTWAPVLAVGLGGDTSWRASRVKGKCDDNQSQSAQLAVSDLAQYFCLYRTARVTYSATLISYPERPKRAPGTPTTPPPTSTTTTPTSTTTTPTSTTTTPTTTTTTPTTTTTG